MRTTIYWLSRCFRSKRVVFLSTILLSFAVAAWADTPAINLFELDGDSITGNQSPPHDDWNLLNGTTGQNGSCTGACKLKEFAVDGDGQTIFTGGGSKDNSDIPNWAYKNGSVPPKDEIQNAYAASYNAPNGDVLVYFGADREAVNGDANIGVWFFQNPVGTNGTGGFTGTHVNHDVFIVSAFTVGGTTPGIQVYEWDSSCGGADNNNPQTGQCADKNLRVLFNSAQTCSASGLGHEACARVNGSATTVSWPYTPAHGSLGDPIPAAGFFEGGINVTELFAGIGQARPCFAAFLVETRSSQSTDAVLKDFVAHSFPQCHVSITKACACTAFHTDGSGYDYSFNGTVTNDGGGTLFNVTVADQGNNYNCGTLDVNQSVNFPQQCNGGPATFSSTAFPATNVASVTANTSTDPSSATVSASTGSVTCDTSAAACSPSPGLEVHKVCVTTLQVLSSNVVVRVDYTGTVKNTGNVNLTASVAEDHNNDGVTDVTFGPFALTPNQSVCYTSGNATCPSLTPPPAGTGTTPGAASYFPNTFTPVTPNGRAEFQDKVTASGTDAFGQAVPGPGSPPVADTAHCLICPFGFCALQ